MTDTITKAETITWPGISGKNYDTVLCKAGIPFVKDPGIYIFCKPASNAGKWTAVYVGECEDFNERLNTNLKNHHRYDCIVKNGATNVCVMKVTGGKNARTAVETDLRQKLDPSCNRQ